MHGSHVSEDMNVSRGPYRDKNKHNLYERLSFLHLCTESIMLSSWTGLVTEDEDEDEDDALLPP